MAINGIYGNVYSIKMPMTSTSNLSILYNNNLLCSDLVRRVPISLECSDLAHMTVYTQKMMLNSTEHPVRWLVSGLASSLVGVNFGHMNKTTPLIF